MMMRPLIGAVVLALMAACGGAGGEDDALATLTIEPATSEHLIENGVAAHQAFTATLVYPDGHVRDVTDETSFIVDSTFGTFTANELAIGTPGKTNVYGTYVDKTSSAQVIARLRSIRVDPSLSPSTPDLFGAPETATNAPKVVYPPVDVVMPRNLGDFETHWTSTGGLDVFEVSLHTEFSDVRVYVPGGNGVPSAGPNPSWTSFAATEWIAAVGRENALTYQVRGIATASPGQVSAAAPRLVRLSNQSMEGGLYYWAAGAQAGGAYGIFRHDMSKPGQPAEEYLTTNQTGGRCVACHVLSRDGSRMAVTYDGGNGRATLLDVATKATQPEAATGWNFGTFAPDGTQFLTVRDGVITVRDSSTQAALATMPAAGYATHPDLSPDGTKLVYVRAATGGADWSFGDGQLWTRSYDATTQTFGAEQPLVTDGNNYYPSWSPDAEWIVFNRSGSNSYNDTTATVWVVKADGSIPPFELTSGNMALGLTNSWARWAPFESTTGATSEPLFWITVSSKRDFGTRFVNTGLAEPDKFPQLWMLAFYPGRVAAGDPSLPAFRLPFQNLDSRNHIAQWTERVLVVQ